MRLATAFINIVLALLMGLFAISALKSHFGGNRTKYDLTLLLKSDGVETVFEPKGTYADASKIGSDDSQFSLTYTYVVNEIKYNGICYVHDTIEIDKKNIKGYYLPENPYISAVDIDKHLIELDAQMKSKKDLKWGSIAGILGVLLMVLGVRSAKLHKKKKQQKNN